MKKQITGSYSIQISLNFPFLHKTNVCSITNNIGYNDYLIMKPDDLNQVLD